METALDKYLKKLGKHIAKLRKEKKMTQSDLADICGVQISAISKAERGLLNFTAKTQIVLCHALDISFDELMRIENADIFFDEIIEERQKTINPCN